MFTLFTTGGMLSVPYCWDNLTFWNSETEVFHKSSKPALPYNFQLKSADSDKGQYGHLFFKGKKDGKIFLAYLSFSDSNVIRTHNHLVHKWTLNHLVG